MIIESIAAVGQREDQIPLQAGEVLRLIDDDDVKAREIVCPLTHHFEQVRKVV
jgi:hypothetical protein